MLIDLYAWYKEVEADLVVLLRDATQVPAQAEARAEEAEATASLVRALARGRPRRKTVRAAVGHAVEFDTWRSLVRGQRLSRKQAVDAMVRFVEGA